MDRSPVDEPLTLTRCHSLLVAAAYEALEGRKPVCGQAYNLKGIIGKIYVFLLFLKLCFSFYCSSFHGMLRASPAGRGNV